MDIGGTFTDVVTYDDDSGVFAATKASTTPGNLSEGVLTGLGSVDWTGSDRDVRGPINLPVDHTAAFCSLIFKAMTTPDTSVVAGNFRPLRVITEPGSVMHAVPPMRPALATGRPDARRSRPGAPAR